MLVEERELEHENRAVRSARRFLRDDVQRDRRNEFAAAGRVF